MNSRIKTNNQVLVLHSDTNRSEDIENFLNHIFDGSCLNKTMFNKVLLCISEGVSNAIDHGNKNNDGKSVRIEVEVERETVWITIEDEGNGFNFRNLPNPTTGKNLKKERGRGLFIIKTYADEIGFDKNGSVLKIKFDLSAEDKVLSRKYSDNRN